MRIMQEVLIDEVEGIQGEIIPSSDNDDDDEEISIITYYYEEGKKAFGIFKQYIEQLVLDHATANDISF